jgi:molybdate transport system ATP-binding protein
MNLQAQIQASREQFHLDVCIEAESSEVVAVVGPNGSGKSTLLRVLAGLTPLRGGRVTLGGVVLDDPARRIHVPTEHRPVGVVFQDLLLFPNMTALDNVAFGLRCRGLSRSEARRQGLEWLHRVGLRGHEHRRPSQLSGGQAQRVALSRALAIRPQLLLLDEPLSALDMATRAEVRRDIKNGLTGFGGVQFIVTHDPAEAMMLADRLVVLEQGRVVQIGSREEVTLRPRSPYVATFIGVNLFRGTAHGDKIMLDDGRWLFAPNAGRGEVFAAVHPRSISLHRLSPDGSARNVWHGRIAHLDDEGDVVRVLVNSTSPVVAEVTRPTVAKLDLVAGAEVWASAKATDLQIYPA